MRKNILPLILLGLTMIQSPIFSQKLKSTTALPTDPIQIWPGDGKGPGSETLAANTGDPGPYVGCDQSDNRKVDGITITTIVPYFPAKPNGTAVIICPGGSYMELSYDTEGTSIAEWLNSINITAFILKYRLPVGGHDNRSDVPLQDAQRAIRVIRNSATSWGLNPNKIGIIGFSAGGHVAASASTRYSATVYTKKDAIDNISARPSFTILCYPLITMGNDVNDDGKSITHKQARMNLLGLASTSALPTQSQINTYSPELNVTASTPEAFLAHSLTDGSVVDENSKLYADALTAQGVSNEPKFYTSGAHGVGICRAGSTDFANWPTDCQAWLNKKGLLTAVNDNQSEQLELSISPNPLTDDSIISFTLPTIQDVEINIYSISGKKTATFMPQNLLIGNNKLPLKKEMFPSKGIYLVTLKTPSQVITQKLCYR